MKEEITVELPGVGHFRFKAYPTMADHLRVDQVRRSYIPDETYQDLSNRLAQIKMQINDINRSRYGDEKYNEITGKLSRFYDKQLLEPLTEEESREYAGLVAMTYHPQFSPLMIELNTRLSNLDNLAMLTAMAINTPVPVTDLTPSQFADLWGAYEVSRRPFSRKPETTVAGS
ncbi:MAG: hypothetical protein HUU10_04515 [Bacteroidetes bacterium]|nr:hypothetical protein [Bacteroidota bacterium]